MATDSDIGYASTTLADPVLASASLIGYATATLRNPHQPLRVWDGSVWRSIPLKVWDGSAWRD